MFWLREVNRLAEAADGRVPPVFRPYHVTVALIMIGQQQPLGRYELCQNMSIGEGTVRTLIKRLNEEEYVEAEGRQGQRLTERGRRLFDQITADIPVGLALDLGKLVMYRYAFANLVRAKGHRVGDGMRQRDEAIIQGGHNRAGATTLVYNNGLLLMPPDNLNILSIYQRETLLILESLRPQNGDAIVIGSATEPNLAREVAMASTMTLFEID